MTERHVCASMVGHVWPPPCASIPDPIRPLSVPLAQVWIFLCRCSVNGSEAGSFPAPVGTSVHRVLFPPAKVERDPPPPPSSFGWFHSRFGSPQLTIYRTARYSFGRRLAPRAPFWLWFPHPISVVVRVHPWRYAGPTRGLRCPPL